MSNDLTREELKEILQKQAQATQKKHRHSR